MSCRKNMNRFRACRRDEMEKPVYYWPKATTEDGETLRTYDSAFTVGKALRQFEIWEDGYGYKIKKAWIETTDGGVIAVKSDHKFVIDDSTQEMKVKESNTAKQVLTITCSGGMDARGIGVYFLGDSRMSNGEMTTQASVANVDPSETGYVNFKFENDCVAVQYLNKDGELFFEGFPQRTKTTRRKEV